MIDVTAYSLPKLPPERWFRHLNLTQESYDAKCVWLLPRLHRIQGFVARNPERDEAEFVAGADALGDVVQDELAAWMTCCWAALATVTHLGPLPAGHHWAVTTDNVPPDLCDGVSPFIREQMRAEAGRYLTAVGQGTIARPLRDWGFEPIVLLISFLLDALAFARHPELYQPVTAEPGEQHP